MLRLYEDDLRLRYAERTGPHYLAEVRYFLDWLEARGIELATVRAEDLQAYQGDPTRCGRREASPTRSRRSTDA